MTEQQVSLQYIYDPQELIKTIDRYCKNAQKIKLYSTNFLDWEYQDDIRGYYSSNHNSNKENVIITKWLKGYLGSLAKGAKQGEKLEIEIYDYGHFNHKDTDKKSEFYFDSDWQKIEKQEYIKAILKQSSTSTILYDFIEVLRKSLEDAVGKTPKTQDEEKGFFEEYIKPLLQSDKENINDTIEKILKTPNKGTDILTNCISKNLQAPLIKHIDLLPEAQSFNKDDIEKSIKQHFGNLIEDIEAINAEGNEQIFKELFKFFLNIVYIFDVKKFFTRVNLLMMGVDVLFEGGKTAFAIFEWDNNKYNYVIYKNLIKLLMEDIAPLLLIVENKIFHQSLIIDDKICIEFSGLDIDNHQAKAAIKQELAVCFRADSGIFKDRNNFDNFEYGIPKDSQDKRDSIMAFGKGSIESILRKEMGVNNNRLTFIESPFFNSIKLAEMIQKNKENQDNTNESNKAQNYLIITNAPQKHNAGLNQKLIEEILGNKIHYPDTIKDEKYNEKLALAPKDEETTIDYSQYKITINSKTEKNGAPFVLSLSPFVRIDYKDYEVFEGAEESYKELLNDRSDKVDIMTDYMNFVANPNNIDKVLSYYHIQQYFIQPENIKAILDKEKQYFKEGINCLQEYIYSIIKVENDVYDYAISYAFPTGKKTLVPKGKYSILEVLLLALTYCVVKDFYISVQTDARKLWNFSNTYERIEVDGEILEILPLGSSLVLEDEKEVSLCFSKKQKEKLMKNPNKSNEEIFCIEEFLQQNGEDSTIYQENLPDIYQSVEAQEAPKEPQKTLTTPEESDTSPKVKSIEEIVEQELKQQSELYKEIEKQLGEQLSKLDKQRILGVIAEAFIDGFFPFKNALEDEFKLGKLLTKALIQCKYKGIHEAFYTLLGFAYLPYVITNYNVKITQEYANSKRTAIREKELSKKALCALIYTKQNQVLLIAEPSLKGLKTLQTKPIKTLDIKSGFLISAFKNASKEVLKSLPQAIAVNLIEQLWVTHYEKIKKEYQRLLLYKFTYKYNPPYAIKQEPKEQEQGSVTYPMEICNTFISSNFVNFITGSKLQTGGLGEKEALFFLERDFSGERIRTYLLNKLLAYLCIDELRSMNGKIEKRIGDIEFFNTRVYTQDLPTRPRLLKLKHEGGEFKAPPNATEQIKANIAKFNQQMQEINTDERRDMLYEEYKKQESRNPHNKNNGEKAPTSAIKAYHTAMNYLDDIYQSSFNTNLNDTILDPLKHRNFLKALDIIGQNNIKALYVGAVEENNEEKSSNSGSTTSKRGEKVNDDSATKKPKLVGRLATTIIMKNGLHLG